MVYRSTKGKRKLDGKRIKANATITVFEKTLIEGAIRDARIQNRILFVDKKRSQLLVKGEEDQSLNSLNKNDFNNNIRNFWDNVNYKHEKKNWKSEGLGNAAFAEAFKKAGIQSTALDNEQSKSNNHYSISGVRALTSNSSLLS